MSSQRSVVSEYEKPKSWIQTKQADIFFGMWILLNACVLAVETDMRDDAKDGFQLVWFVLDSFFNMVFLVEILMRTYAEKMGWLKSRWNVFDIVLVSLGVVDTWVLTFIGTDLDVRFVSMLRILRLMRLLRLLRIFRMCKELMLIIVGIASAMRAMVWGLFILGTTIFMCSLVLTRLVGKGGTFTDPIYYEYFGTMFRTAFTLLQFTMEFQPDICRQTWGEGAALTLFLIVYTCFTNLTILNIIGSIIVDTIMNISGDMSAAVRTKAEIEKERERTNELKEKFAMIDANGDGFLDLQEASNSAGFEQTLDLAGLDIHDARELFEVLDSDESGQVSAGEFVEAAMRFQKPPQAKHLLQIERRLVAMDLKMKDSMAQVLKLLLPPIDPASHATHCQQESAPTSQTPHIGHTQDMMKPLLTAQQLDWEGLRHQLNLHMEHHMSRIQELHMAMLTCFEGTLKKHTQGTDEDYPCGSRIAFDGIHAI